MTSEPIRFYDRYRKTIETEAVYGEAWLRWAYENPLGRATTWLIARRALFSHYFGWRMNWRASAQRVFPFIVDYNLDVEEFAKSAFEYRTFNEFFVRRFRAGARPWADAPGVMPAFAEARYFGWDAIRDDQTFPVKGTDLSATALLGNAALAREFGALGNLKGCSFGDVERQRFDLIVNATSASLRGEVPLAWLNEAELDRIIGSLYTYIEQAFPALLRLAFASKFS